MKITIERDPSYAPCGYLLVPQGHGTRDEGHTVLIDSDWDFPAIAGHLGFVPCNQCEMTDGTVACEHKTTTEMIGAAMDFLDSHLGEPFEDPGYFQN